MTFLKSHIYTSSTRERVTRYLQKAAKIICMGVVIFATSKKTSKTTSFNITGIKEKCAKLTSFFS